MDGYNAGGVRRGIVGDIPRRALLTGLVCLCVSSSVRAQFSSGSTGVNDNFPPLPAGVSTTPTGTRYLIWNLSTGLVRYCSQYDTTNIPETCTTETGTGQISGIPQGGLTTGVFDFANVDVKPAPSSGALDIYLVGNVNNSPLTILSQNDIHFGTSVTLHAEGQPGVSVGAALQPNLSLPGGRPGPGGFAGGSSGFSSTTAGSGNPGFGPTGGVGAGTSQCSNSWGQDAGIPPNTASSLPLLGGSGGAGGASLPAATCGLGHSNGGSGGGGGGAVLMAATHQISFDASVGLWLFGGDRGQSFCGCLEGGGGGGGNLRLVASTLLSASNASAFVYGGLNRFGGRPAGGTISVEGDTHQFALNINGQRSGNISATPGAVSPPNTPTLRVTSVDNIQVPAAATGNVNIPDVTFPTPPSGPVAVTLSGSNIPIGTTAKVRVTPQVGSFAEVTSSSFTGTAGSSTATASVSIPPGFGAITASATFSCDGTICAILPAQDRAGAVVQVVADSRGSHAFILKRDGTRIDLPAGNH